MPNGVSSAARAPGKAPPAGMLAAWLLLLTVLTHALLPLGAPWTRTSGSAFSASTVEVSTAPARARQQAKAGLTRRADPPRAALMPVLAPAAAPAVVDRGHNLGGGPRRTAAQPRAPPIS